MDSDSKERIHRAVQHAVEEFNAGLYFECHETIESVWRHETDPPLKDFLQGFIHMAAAMVHQRRGNIVGFTQQMAKGRGRWQNADLDKFGRMFGYKFDEVEKHAKVASSSQERLRPPSIGLEVLP